MIFYSTPDSKPSEVVGRAFANGSDGEYVEARILRSGPSAFYGTSHFTLPVIKACRERGIDYYYIDNGYFRPSQHIWSDFSGYYKVTKNAEQHMGTGNHHKNRWRKLGIKMKPWGAKGDKVLIVCQSDTYFMLRGLDSLKWLERTKREISKHTDREIIVRPKSNAYRKRHPIQSDLDRAWCVVCYTSNVAVEAITQGIPAYVTAPCASQIMAGDIKDIESPVFKDRDQWAANLACNQWTIEEMRDGTCWRQLNEQSAEGIHRLG